MGNVDKISIYIDGNNLHRSARELGFEIDYKKFRGWLRQKFNPNKAYLFIGLVPERIKFYEYLQNCGYVLVFKQTISIGEKIKGNCDAELVLKTVSDLYEKEFDMAVLLTGDGDFGCLIDFLKYKKSVLEIIAPDKNKCSILLKNKNVKITFLNDIYHKFSKCEI